MSKFKSPFQFDRPLFVRIPFRAAGRDWPKEAHFPWKEMNMDTGKISILYREGFLIHNDEYEGKVNVGDGLELVDVAGLHEIVKDYNARVAKIAAGNKAVLQRRHCSMSKLGDKQRGLLRSWRRNHLDWLEKAEANK